MQSFLPNPWIAGVVRKKRSDLIALEELDEFVCEIRNILALPKFMKGMVKSTACSRSYVMVKSAMAKSAFWNDTAIYTIVMSKKSLSYQFSSSIKKNLSLSQVLDAYNKKRSQAKPQNLHVFSSFTAL